MSYVYLFSLHTTFKHHYTLFLDNTGNTEPLKKRDCVFSFVFVFLSSLDSRRSQTIVLGCTLSIILRTQNQIKGENEIRDTSLSFIVLQSERASELCLIKHVSVMFKLERRKMINNFFLL